LLLAALFLLLLLNEDGGDISRAGFLSSEPLFEDMYEGLGEFHYGLALRGQVFKTLKSEFTLDILDCRDLSEVTVS